MLPAADIQRKLAVILAADVVGYSGIAENDEYAAVMMLRDLRDNVIRPSLTRHNGRLFKEMGDCFLVEFANAAEATLAASDIQRTMANRPQPEAGETPKLRIAIHAGSVVVEDNDLLGDTVNIASRVQSLAPPGGLCMTGIVHDMLSPSSNLGYRALGPCRLRNLVRPVTLFDVNEAELLGTPAKHPVIREAHPPVIAVLAFENLGGAVSQYLSEGIAIEVIAALSRFHSIRVLSSASSFSFRQTSANAIEVARSLGTDYILQGSILGRGTGFRLVVSLIDGETGANCWAETYDYAPDEVLSMQGRLAESIANMLEGRVFQSRLSRIERSPAETVAAYDCWLRGHFLLNQWTVETDEQALQWFNRAILQDARFARAHASIAAVCITRRLLQPGNPHEAEDLARAMKHSRLAIELDDTDARNHVNHAWGLMQARDFRGGKRHFELAEKLNPHAADILIACALGEAYLDNAEKARFLSGRAFDLNPLYPNYYLANLAMIRFLGGEYEEASEIGSHVRETLPEMSGWVTAALGCLGQAEEATDEARRFLSILASRWCGVGSPNPDQAVKWFLSVNPVKSKKSLAALIEGLALAGLAVNGGILPL